ncbi:hypothetical protein PybrP1_012270 [[Pythium] brassicae (nom. inval.)]|nr:hypothetical protein PybrP1_012270 [[Pythium] brassicae (nom. inval.)]
MWIRGALMTFTMTQGFLVDGRALIPELPLTRRDSFVIAAVPSAVNTAFLVAVAAAWAFPIPFMNVLFGFPYMVTLTCAVVAWVRTQPGRHQVPEFRSRARTFILYFSTQSVLGVIYPVYSAVYSDLRGLGQLGFTMALFPIKLVMKNLVARSCKSDLLADYVPEITNFTAGLFHSLYLLSSVQTQGFSVGMTLVLTVAEVANTLLAIRALQRQGSKIGGNQRHIDVVTACLALIQMNSQDQAGLHNVRRKPSGAPTTRSKIAVLGKSSTQVAPVEAKGSESVRAASFPSAPDQQGSRQTEDADSRDTMLRILFTSEFLLLSEYVGCIIPLLFAIYTQVLSHLANAKYYPDSKDGATMARILLLLALKFGEFVGVCLLLQQRLRLPGVYQLAFVLELQYERILTKLLCYITFCLFFPIKHYALLSAVLLESASPECDGSIDDFRSSERQEQHEDRVGVIRNKRRRDQHASDTVTDTNASEPAPSNLSVLPSL